MALSSDKKLYISLTVLAVLGGALYFQNQSAAADRKAHSYEGMTNLPALSISEEDTNAVTRIVIEQPAKEGDDASPASKHVLVKDGDNWRLEEPVKATAHQANVASVLKNLQELKVKERLTSDGDLQAAYAKHELTDDKAVHATFFAGEEKKHEFWFGKSGGRGQTARWTGADGVYLVDGYSSFLYTRDTKGWRDLSIFKFEPDDVTAVTIENEHGSYELKKEGEEWTGKLKKAKAPAATKIKDFEGSKVEDMLRAYKALNANGFGDGKKPEEVGLDEPLATVVIQLSDGAQRKLVLGANAESSSRWARTPDKETIYSVSSWAADWAFAEESKFQKAADADADADATNTPTPGGPLPGGGPLPAGHP